MAAGESAGLGARVTASIVAFTPDGWPLELPDRNPLRRLAARRMRSRRLPGGSRCAAAAAVRRLSGRDAARRRDAAILAIGWAPIYGQTTTCGVMAADASPCQAVTFGRYENNRLVVYVAP